MRKILTDPTIMMAIAMALLGLGLLLYGGDSALLFLAIGVLLGRLSMLTDP